MYVHIQRIKGKISKRIPSKWDQKASSCLYPNTWQDRIQKETNDKEVLIKKILHTKHIWIILWYTQFHEKNTNGISILISLNRQINTVPIIVGNFTVPLSPNDKSYGHKLNRKISELNDILHQMDLINMYRIFHPNGNNIDFTQ